MSSRPLARVIGGAGFFALAFGSIVGSGWVVVLGDWLHAAGPGGAVLGFLAGGLLMSLVAAAYGELLARHPRAGSEFTFIQAGLGPRWAGICGWFIALHTVAFTAFEALALVWILEILFPSLAAGPVAYELLGYDVSIVTLAVGFAGAVLLTIFNCRGAHLAVGLQQTVTFAFIAASAALIVLGFARGSMVNWQPLLAAPPGGSALGGMLWVAAGATLFLSGFQSAANAVEERAADSGVAPVARAMIASVLAATAFYGLIILAASAMRSWQELPGQALPTAAAFEPALPDGLAVKLVLLTAAVSLLKTWNAIHLSASRLLLAQARAGLLPRWLEEVDRRHGVPRNAIVFVGVLTCLSVCLGRGAIVPIINMSTICIASTVVLCLAALLRLRRRSGPAPEFRLGGGTPVVVSAMLGAAASAVVAASAPFALAPGVPLEYRLLGGWALLGLALAALRKLRERPVTVA